MSKPAAIVRSPKGNPITHSNPARVEFAVEALRAMTYTKARDAIMAQFGVSLATAARDIAAARQLIALEFGDVVTIRAREATRLERLAEKAEGLADHASNAKDYQGAAALKGKAIQASKEIARLTGAAAPRELKVTHSSSVSVDVELKLDAVLDVTAKILTSDEYDFLMRVMEKLAAAQDSGAFKELEPPVDAELVDDADDKN